MSLGKRYDTIHSAKSAARKMSEEQPGIYVTVFACSVWIVVTGPCVLTQQTHGYACGHCGSLLAIHSHGYIVERI